MKHVIIATIFTCILAQASWSQAPVFGEDKIPSYFEMDEYNHRFPETDTNVEMYMHNYMNSPVYRGSVQHGGWVEREYLFPGDPTNPSRPGAVLSYMKSYNHGSLDANTWTQKTKSDKEQVFFYILEGTGRVEAGDKKVDISEGNGIFVPAGVTYQFFNTCKDTALKAIIVTEEIGEGFEPMKEIVVGSYKDHMPRAGMHWAHIGRGILDGADFYNPVGFAIVTVDAFDMAQPHLHGPGVEEVWCQIKGTSLLLFGNRLFRQEPGTAFLIPPNFRVPHSSINPSEEPMMWLYMGNRHDARDSREHDYHYERKWKE